MRLLSGRAHQVITGVAAIAPDGRFRTRAVVTRVSFKRLTTDEIETYVRCGEGIGKAGGYAIQGRAETFVRRINGSYSNVVGLPLAGNDRPASSVRISGFVIICRAVAIAD